VNINTFRGENGVVGCDWYPEIRLIGHRRGRRRQQQQQRGQQTTTTLPGSQQHIRLRTLYRMKGMDLVCVNLRSLCGVVDDLTRLELMVCLGAETEIDDEGVYYTVRMIDGRMDS